MTAAVTFEDVSFTYPDAATPALTRASFTIEEGSFVLVAGETGAGKSTLLRAVNGLVPHFSGGRFQGRVVVGGRDTLAGPPRALADVVAFVPQDPGAAFVVDRVEDELAYGMENLGVDRAVMRRRVEEVLDLLSLTGLRDRSVRTLSGGERQRVAIGAALTPGARLLVLDEPTSQLDPQGAEDALAALQRLVHDLGMTVLLAEHRLERVAGFADVALGCRAGAPPVAGAPAEVLERLGAGPPVARLGRALGWDPVPLTVRDARRRAPAPPPAQARSPHVPGPGDGFAAARGIHASYDGRRALAGVDLTVARGEVVVVVGRNGAGKTTLLRCLAGLHEPDRGTIEIAGHAPRAGRGVALCPQRPESALFSERVDEEVAATLRAAGRGEDAASILEDFGLSDVAAAHPRDLSAGQRALVAAAAIVATGAELVLLDEPTRGLDARCKKDLARVMRRAARAGGAVVVATHDVELAAEVATRVVVLAGGEVVAEGDPAQVLGDSSVFAPQMTRVFGPGWLTVEQVAGAFAG